ncbi:MAG: Do family serine endopeptidase [Rickettsia sp.]|nr:Do family serine endopeptidase [Rickettsia sp.]
MRLFFKNFIFLLIFCYIPNVLAGNAVATSHSIAPVLNKILPSVVNLSVTKKKSSDIEGLVLDPSIQKFFEEFGQHFGFKFRSPEQEEKSIQVLGSGVIIDSKNGYVITNHHVIVEAEEITVTLNDNRSFTAKLLGSDKETDLAVLQILDFSNLSDCKMGDSSLLQVGDFVVAIGNPFGLSHTVTSGIVSALGRAISDGNNIGNFIQTDASINPGNSGGALINFNGELIGINSSIFSTNRGNIGIGFAIPSNMVKLVSSQLITKGIFERGRLGIEVQNISPEMIEALDLPKNFVTGGSIVTKIEPGSPASKAGLQIGDIVIAVDGVNIKNNLSLSNAIASKAIGEKTTLKILRNKKIQEINIQILKIESIYKTNTETSSIEQLKGVYFSNISSEHKLYGKIEGILISKIDQSSKIAKLGVLNVGDIIQSINQEKVKSVSDLASISKKTSSKKPVLLNIYHENGSSRFLALK